MSLSLNPLTFARQLAARGQFERFAEACQTLAEARANDADLLHDLGNLYADHGFLRAAHDCMQRVCALRPSDLGAVANLANVARDAGDHAQARQLYARLLAALPDHPVVRRNYLTGLEYDPAITDADRVAAARAWGQWAT